MRSSFSPLALLFAGAALVSSLPDAGVAVSSPAVTAENISPPEPNVLEVAHLERRRACSGHRLQNDVCQGRLIYQGSSRHNCYRKDGKCCAKNKNRDYGIAVTNRAQKGEDCAYCFSGTSCYVASDPQYIWGDLADYKRLLKGGLAYKKSYKKDTLIHVMSVLSLSEYETLEAKRSLFEKQDSEVRHYVRFLLVRYLDNAGSWHTIPQKVAYNVCGIVCPEDR
ncbi:hypothetical protein OOU_Y34scaffold00548g76 [Pyricularia oryzae Y34]|uniref:Uncharacterized protein n=2 Tax=Pyricularia oryzae TaxID=318829 RepID=A0AA97NXT4_PYRO3|nr:hypothetical protein OOU_Y34scaffold00548g76 [Pyricularia oryzae Y34]